MSEDLYKIHPEWANDADMKKIDKALSESDIDEALATCNHVLEDKMRQQPLEKAIKAHVLVHMGVLYYRKKDLDNARKKWDEALEIESYEPDARHNKDKITGGKPGKK